MRFRLLEVTIRAEIVFLFLLKPLGDTYILHLRLDVAFVRHV